MSAFRFVNICPNPPLNQSPVRLSYLHKFRLFKCYAPLNIAPDLGKQRATREAESIKRAPSFTPFATCGRRCAFHNNKLLNRIWTRPLPVLCCGWQSTLGSAVYPEIRNIQIIHFRQLRWDGTPTLSPIPNGCLPSSSSIYLSIRPGDIFWWSSRWHIYSFALRIGDGVRAELRTMWMRWHRNVAAGLWRNTWRR